MSTIYLATSSLANASARQVAAWVHSAMVTVRTTLGSTGLVVLDAVDGLNMVELESVLELLILEAMIVNQA